MTKVCICQICNCGRHRCPHNPTGVINKGGAQCSLSEYTDKYPKHPLDTRKPIKPEAQTHRNAGPLEDKTTNRVDYIPHPLEKPYVHRGEEYRPPSGEFDPNTNYKNDYTRKPMERTKPAKQNYQRKVPGKFEGDPTYKLDYRKWDLGPRDLIKQDAGYRPPSAPFDGDPTYKRDYIKHNAPPRQSLRPLENAKVSDQAFDDTTGYKTEYIKHPMPERYMKEKQVYQPNQVPLDGMTTNKRDYTPKKGDKMRSCRPEAGAYKSTAPLDDNTTHRNDYQKWAAERPFVHEPEQYMKPEGDIDFHTTTHNDYDKKPLEKQMARRPPSRAKVPGKFYDDTTHKDDYRKWSADGRPKVTMKSDYQPPEAPFEGTATYTRDYIGHQGAPRRSMKPAESGVRSDAPFDDHTMYRSDYVPKEVPPCPAALLDTTRARFNFREQDPSGHKWYEPTTSTTISPLGNHNGNAASLNKQLSALAVA